MHEVKQYYNLESMFLTRYMPSYLFLNMHQKIASIFYRVW